jgi:hypothetical protein
MVCDWGTAKNEGFQLLMNSTERIFRTPSHRQAPDYFSRLTPPRAPDASEVPSTSQRPFERLFRFSKRFVLVDEAGQLPVTLLPIGVPPPLLP